MAPDSEDDPDITIKSAPGSILGKEDVIPVNPVNLGKSGLLELWKSLNVLGYTLKFATKIGNEETTNTRAMTPKQPLEIGVSSLTQISCISDAIKLWNLAPTELKNVSPLYAMKKATRIYVNSLPM